MDVLPGMDGRLGRELGKAVSLATTAGALVLRLRDQELGVELKPGDEPVTIADRQASDLVVKGLRAAFPADVVISEENADDPARLTARRVWFVDPIDGTADFIAGRPGFSVMIGLCERHVPVLGVVYQPVGDRLFWAAHEAIDAAEPGRWGKPGERAAAWFLAPGATPRQLRVSDVAASADIRLVASASHRDHTIDEVKSALGISNELNIGSVGLKLGLIALAERDLYVNPSSKSKAWDTCAPEAILVAAGGMMTDTHGEPLRYDRRDLARKSGLVASNGLIHAEVLARLAHLFPRPS
ncbi:MAG: 3'(2'),5'-bisphosphate nucleotidase CysQ [Kofleriaceae bacterium]|nr:3'(2'),5'-bisphosphate nucleotidase CysQ [Myxococcales bacterium]MCB9564062.1 3'(2'),5'-bisphosphate nucleotidase CysQ [Kofleriaceae bacterium]MCB9572572.1 3'(2'),5'-bisphosphate nucleotidase CysQ [Kofleriaceae bacterium]